MKKKMLNLISQIYHRTPSSLIRRVPSVYAVLRDLANFESNEYANLSFLEEGLKDKPNSIDNKHHEDIVKRLFHSYRKAKNMQTNVLPVYKPGEEWEERIKTRRAEYLEALNGDDTAK